ncbi:sodium-dependent transporter [Angelakisella massiliensis]|uniref:sodium-dependent transporter n=1 Tax=Angelakisella massiliensis TaxID=1871018 RepID=UPI0008F8C9DC|nr:sodium-dependent transporter [Angelakisella massiliensis]
MERERFGSRLGFLLLSAGCAIGIGNVWRFPYVVGQNGGGIFVVFYLVFLVIVGVPILTMELAVGRASKKSIIREFETLEPAGTKWHWYSPLGMLGNYVLMMFYTTVAGWMLAYFQKFAAGDFEGLSPDAVKAAFDQMLAEPLPMAAWMVFVVVLGFVICAQGLQKGVERISKWMMLALLLLILILAVRSVTLPGGEEGLAFYLLPDAGRLGEDGLLGTVVEAMKQAFFTLSLGIGAMAIFGSYLDRDHRLMGEAVSIAALDTFVAVTAGLIIFPACFAFGINPNSGPELIFITLPNVFNNMAAGRLWGALFFLFMSFAALSTVLAVFENILSCTMDLTGISRTKACLINGALIILLSLPCVLGYNLWSDFRPLGPKTRVLDLEDFVVSTVLLPLGSLIYLLFCTHRLGWGFRACQKEANQGKGLAMPSWLRGYLTWVLPFLVLIVLLLGLYSSLSPVL